MNIILHIKIFKDIALRGLVQEGGRNKILKREDLNIMKDIRPTMTISFTNEVVVGRSVKPI